jgi:hypothetical protein
MPSALQQSGPLAEHVVLLGDSIFANAAYIGREPDVVGHLRTLLPTGWTAALRAVDGATTTGLTSQIKGLPANATRLFVSIGGNDALANIDLLAMKVSSSAEVLAVFARRIGVFEHSYRDAVERVLASGLPTTVCTIYNGRLPDDEAPLARTALSFFNDAVLRIASSHALDVIELRGVCDEPSDYANAIEPSSAGGRKIAVAIAATLGVMPSRAPARIWTARTAPPR